MSEAYQPRYAAFLASLGRTDEGATAKPMLMQFMTDFIPRCRRTAPPEAYQNGHIVNHDAFTAHCWAVARDDLLKGFPA